MQAGPPGETAAVRDSVAAPQRQSCGDWGLDLDSNQKRHHFYDCNKLNILLFPCFQQPPAKQTHMKKKKIPHLKQITCRVTADNEK